MLENISRLVLKTVHFLEPVARRSEKCISRTGLRKSTGPENVLTGPVDVSWPVSKLDGANLAMFRVGVEV